LALDILLAIPVIGDLLSQLNQRNAYDFDNKAGNQFRGHAGFPSIPDDTTYSARLNADREAILQALLDLHKEIQMPQDGLTPASKRNVTDALRTLPADPGNSRLRREQAEQAALAAPVTKEVLSETRQRAKAAQERSEKAAMKGAVNFLSRLANKG